MSTSFVPHRGDLVWLSFDPQAGREQAGRRPALVLSPRGYNERAGLALVCPVTSRVKGYPFEVALPVGGAISGGVVLADQVRNIDWRARHAAPAGLVGGEVIAEVQAKIRALLTG